MIRANVSKNNPTRNVAKYDLNIYHKNGCFLISTEYKPRVVKLHSYPNRAGFDFRQIADKTALIHVQFHRIDKIPDIKGFLNKCIGNFYIRGSPLFGMSGK